VLGDADRLQQVIWNLLSNAIKFTPREGSVEVRLRQAGVCVEVEVSDNGAGIRPDFLPYVFDRFRQAESTITRSHGGLGLGLSIVRHLVELHGGTVEVRSAGEGQGAAFTVLLPVRSAAAGECVPPRAVVAAVETAAPWENPALLRGLHVLVVEDEEDTRDLLVAALEQHGARVTAVSSAAAALEHLDAGPADVLVSDLAMPDEDGYALIRQVRERPAAQGGCIPAAALTAYARAEDRLRALEAGYQTHLAKPVDPSELIATVARLAGRTALAP